MSALENFFVKNEINLHQARFVCMDTTSVRPPFCSKGACSVSDANTYYELCLQSLNELKEKSNYCNSKKI